MELEGYFVLRTKTKSNFEKPELFSLDSIYLELANGKSFILGFQDYNGDLEKINGLWVYEVEQSDLETCWDDSSSIKLDFYENTETITWEKLKEAKIEDFCLTGEDGDYMTDFIFVKAMIINQKTREKINLIRGT